MLAWRKAAALGLCVGLTACAAIWGFEDGVLETIGSDSGPPPGNDAGSDSPVITLDASDGEAPIEDLFEVADNAPPGCAARVVDADTGIFAHAAVGTDGATCGTKDEPCKSFTAALQRAIAKGAGTKYVYLASGTYTGSVSIPANLPANLIVQGAWRTRTAEAGTGLEWIRDCRADTASRTIIKGDQAKVIAAAGPAADAGADAGVLAFGLSTLSVQSKALAQNGESLYGVFLTQATVRFEDVWLKIEEGGAGNPGTPGTAGANGATTGCAPAAAGTAGAPGAGSGPVSFTANGVTGGDGLNGGNGGNGATGSAANTTGSCVTCKDTCDGVNACVGYPAAGKLCGTDGLGGCGGGGGKPGSGGTAGGSSIGVYAWGGKVEFVRTKTVTGPGGPGGLGAKGGAGGTPAAGAPGTDTAATCFTDCNVLTCVTPKKGTAGGAGATGTNGAAGGIGGGGAGGHAFCVVALQGSQLTNIAELDCNAKGGGTGGPVPDGGVPGTSGKSGVVTDGGL